MGQLVSEPLVPVGGFEAHAMSTGEPGLPAAFRWRDRTWTIAAVLRRWKESSREGGRATGDLYLRRHCYQLQLADGSVWTVYFTRHAPRGQPRAPRWFLFTIDQRGAGLDSADG